MKKILISFLTISLILFIVTGCNYKNNNNKTTTNNDVEDDVTIDVQTSDNIYNLKYEVKTGTYKGTKSLVKNKYIIAQNKSDYKIVIANDAKPNESLAANELQTLLFESTSYRIPIIYEDEVESSDKIISLGFTKEFLKLKENVDYSTYHRSGYRILTKGDNIYITGAKESQAQGTLYGAYEFLHQTLNYECYSENCYYIDKVRTLSFYEMDITIIPQIETRSVRYNWTDKNNLFNNRMKMVNRYVNQTDWILDGHTNLVILPYETYGAEHPDWYINSKSANGNQLCLTNEEMLEEYIKRVKQFISTSEKGVYFMLANMDNYDYCTCDKCKAEIERCGTVGGYNVAFVNKVADNVGEWLKQNYPDRDVTFVTYAYQSTYAAPVKENEDGSFSPYCDDVILHDNVAIMIAPVEMDYGVPITDSENKRFSTDFKKWVSISKQIAVFDYGTYFFDYFAFLNSFSSLAENIRFYAENGCIYYYNLLPVDTASFWFYDLRTYINSKLVFCPYYDIDELIKDFMDHYYVDASEPMIEIFNELRTWYTYLHDELRVTNYVMSTQWSGKSEMWPRALLLSWYSKINEAYSSIEKYKESNAAYYETLRLRIRLLELGIDYYQFRFYSAYLTDSEHDELYEKFAKDIALCGVFKNAQEGNDTFYLDFKR